MKTIVLELNETELGCEHNITSLRIDGQKCEIYCRTCGDIVQTFIESRYENDQHYEHG